LLYSIGQHCAPTSCIILASSDPADRRTTVTGIAERRARPFAFARADNWWFSKIPPLLGISYLCILMEDFPAGTASRRLGCYLISIACVATYGHIVNDAFDVDADLRAHKFNPMSRLRWSSRALLAISFLVAGFLPSLIADYSGVSLMLLAANYLWPTIYSIPGIRLKERGLSGVVCDAMGSHVTPTLLLLSVFGLLQANASTGVRALASAATLWSAALGIKGILHHQILDRESDAGSGTNTFATNMELATILRFLARFNLWVELPISVALAAIVFRFCPLAAISLAVYIGLETLRFGLGERLVIGPDPRATRAIVPFTNELFYIWWLPMAAALQLALVHPVLWWLPGLHAGVFYMTLPMALTEMAFTRRVILGSLQRPYFKAANVEAARETTEPEDVQLGPCGSSDWTIVLFASGGVASFVENALIGVRQCGIDSRIVQLVCPEIARSELGPVAKRYGARVRALEDMVNVNPAHMPSSYVNWNTDEFNVLMSYRFPVLRLILAEGKNVIASDVDVAWLRNPLPYLSDVLHHYPWACQVEAKAEFPPTFCLGFFAVRAAPDIIELIDLHIALLEANDVTPADQVLFREILVDNPRFLTQIFPLPESAFPTGLLYRSVLNDDPAVSVVDRTEPFIFHANWCVGLDNKQQLLAHIGAWLLPDHDGTTRTRPATAPKQEAGKRFSRLLRKRFAFLNPGTANGGVEYVIELKEPGSHSYALPAGTTRLRIVSDVVFLKPDTRKLGAAVTRIALDGVTVLLSDASLMSGFHAIERDGPNSWRWTNGAALIALPFKPATAQMDIDALFIAAKMRAE